MHISSPSLSSIGTSAMLACCALVAAPAWSADYTIDPDHTYAAFEIGHFGTSTNRAQFEKTQGSVSFDRMAHTGKVDVRIDTRSVHSISSGFAKHLQEADLFNTEKYPEMRFVSDRFTFDGDRLRQVQGQLTLLGQTHPVTFQAQQFNCYQSPMLKTEVCGGDFVATIDRTQWGMDYAVKMGFPKEVRLVVQIEAKRD